MLVHQPQFYNYKKHFILSINILSNVFCFVVLVLLHGIKCFMREKTLFIAFYIVERKCILCLFLSELFLLSGSEFNFTFCQKHCKYNLYFCICSNSKIQNMQQHFHYFPAEGKNRKRDWLPWSEERKMSNFPSHPQALYYKHPF